MELKFQISRLLVSRNTLLIVPYGIEMKYRFILAVTLMAFNRTLWN